MAFSRLPLSYCTNVHPGRSVAEVEDGLDRYTVAVKEAFGRPLAAGLWLAEPVIHSLHSSSAALDQFRTGLIRRGLTCHTLNAFPYGDFHSSRVKEKVYLPDWSDPRRLEYTLRCASVLAELLPDGSEGSISTLPLGFKGFDHSAEFLDVASEHLLNCARRLAVLEAATGKHIRLAVEPEPMCLLETTGEAIKFFQQLWHRARHDEILVHNYIGLCYDVCHQAVEFEDVAVSIAVLDRAGVRINKVHISCALQLDRPAENQEGRQALRQYVEPRYLHQTIARSKVGNLIRAVDLSEELIDRPPADFAQASQWRIHFHVPVDAEQIGPLMTTRQELKRALAAIGELNYAPHLEVETYTWPVLPGENVDLVRGLTRELLATETLIAELDV